MEDSALLMRLRRRARQLRSRAVDEILSSDGRAEAFGSAVRRVQGGKRVLDESGARVLAALGLATQRDLEQVGRKVGRLRKRMERILDRLEDL